MTDSSREENDTESHSHAILRKIAPYAFTLIIIAIVIAFATGLYYGLRAASPPRNVTTHQENTQQLKPRRFLQTITDPAPQFDRRVKTRRLKRIRTYIVANTALNYTNANQSCTVSFPNGMLAFPKNLEQEETMMAAFIDAYEKEKEKLQYCQDQFFIGLRKVLDEEWLSAEGELAAFGPPISLLKHNRLHDFADEHCSQIFLAQENTYLINNINCDSHVWNCFVCQYLCNKARPYCYSVHHDRRVRSYNDALLYCQFQKMSSSLAVVPHISILKLITQQMEFKRCKNAGIGHRFSGRYESPAEEKLSYETKRIYYRPGGGKHISYNCIVINAANHYKWEVESCSKPHCYVCASKE